MGCRACWSVLVVVVVSAASIMEEPCSPGVPGCDIPHPGLPPPLPLGGGQAGLERCEDVQVAACVGALPYSSVGLPNVLGHTSQAAAGLLMGMLRPALASRCSPDLRRLLCTVLLPPCRSTPRQRLPCRGLCQRVRAGCEGLMHAHGILWPGSLDCHALPAPEEGCIGPEDSDSPTSPPTPVTTTTPTTLPPRSRCEDITGPVCQDMPYNKTVLPNMFGHESQEEVEIEMYQFSPLVSAQCSMKLHPLMCSVYLPPCTILERPLPPCRDLCLSAKDKCEKYYTMFGFQWPEFLDCNKFPAESEEVCVGGQSAT